MTRHVVFDTSVAVSALLFRRGQLAWLRSHWAASGCVPLISSDTGKELTKVLRHRKFRLTTNEFNEALGAYLPYCEIVEVSRKCNVACRDVKDQPFLDLAHSGKAESLVSGDRDLQVLAGQTKFLIETPEEYRRRTGWN